MFAKGFFFFFFLFPTKEKIRAAIIVTTPMKHMHASFPALPFGRTDVVTASRMADTK